MGLRAVALALDRSRRSFALAALGGCTVAGVAKARQTNTHGRWPWFAAIAAPPVTTALYENRGRVRTLGQAATWSTLPLLLWHQTEEWVLPAGFLPWFNRSLWRSEDDEFPLTPRFAVGVNVFAGWGLSMSAVATVTRTPWLASAVLSTQVANGALHVGAALRERRYNPGLATAPAIAAVGLVGTASMMKDERVRRHAALGVVTGLAASAAVPLRLRTRLRRDASA